MKNRIGLRQEDKNDWEKRVALIPSDVRELTAGGIGIEVQSFRRRVFNDVEYEKAGARLTDDVRGCEIVFGIKEMPVDYFRPGGAYVFFSHTIKGQRHNMEMLAALVDRECTLLDYEIVTDEQNQRLIFFGRYAGLAGMFDTLWTVDRRLRAQGRESPFAGLQPAHAYDSLEQCRAAVEQLGRTVARGGIPEELAPMVFGITGYGNVSQGAQEILDLLPVIEVSPSDLQSFVAANGGLTDKVVKVVYHEKDLVERSDGSGEFNLQEYYDRPERFRSVFQAHLEHLSVLINGIYWDSRYPKLADRGQLRQLFSGEPSPRLIAVGDVTCDVDGSLACTTRATEPGEPVYIYDPETGKSTSGFKGDGIAVMAVENLPSELPKEASETFSKALKPFIPALASADLEAGFDDVALPGPIRRSVILWRGRFTPEYSYMKGFLR